jgi:hypothetical protein
LSLRPYYPFINTGDGLNIPPALLIIAKLNNTAPLFCGIDAFHPDCLPGFQETVISAFINQPKVPVLLNGV